MATQVHLPAHASTPAFGLRRYAWAVVAYNVLVILWGLVVRATGSGNGCGEHWPLCGGTVEQHWKTAASIIEFAHRATAGIDTVAIVALIVLTWRAVPRFHLARVAVATAGLFTVTEAFLGAMLVELGLTAQNHSPLRAWYLALHLANTHLLLASLALTAHFLGRTTARMRGGIRFESLLSVIAALTLTMLAGMAGSVAALADTLYPARSLAAGLAEDFAPGAPLLLHMRWLHPALSLVAAGAIVALVYRASLSANTGIRVNAPGTSPTQIPGGGLLLSLVGVQLLLGVADVVSLAPTAMQVAHLAVADALWIALVVFVARLSIQPAGCTGSACHSTAVTC